MIDLHCHILPGIDDGAADLRTSLAMARMAVADGITVAACTPHMMPGIFDNAGPAVRAAIAKLQAVLDSEGIALKLVCGADVHIAPDLIEGLRSGRILSLNDSRYFLFEPPHHVAPPRLAQVVFDIMAAGYRPIITHPERLTWIENHYDVITHLADRGVWMQVTAGALTGVFGRRASYWGDRMLDEGRVHLLASDAHDLRHRVPVLSDARRIVAKGFGEAIADQMVDVRPQMILDDQAPIAGIRTETRDEAKVDEGDPYRLSARRRIH